MRKTIVTGCLVLLASAGSALAGPPLSLEAAVQLASRPGSWIESDGDLLADGTFQGKEYEIYSAENEAELEEAAIYGAVTDLNRAKSTMRVLGYVVTWDAQTTLKDENKRQILSSKLKDGIGVKVQGSLDPNGTFKATKIKLQGEKNVNGKIKIKEKIFGPVTVLDARDGHMRVLNTTIIPRPNASFIEVTPQLTN